MDRPTASSGRMVAVPCYVCGYDADCVSGMSHDEWVDGFSAASPHAYEPTPEEESSQ